MADDVLIVPERFADLFREGLVDSIRTDADALESVAGARSTEVAHADLRASLAQLTVDIELLARLDAGGKGDVTLADADAAAVAHACEAMARAVCGPRLAERLTFGPFEGDLVVEIVRLSEATRWAAEEADRFHDVAGREREAAKVVA